MIDERFPNWDIDIENGTIYSLRLSRYIGTINNLGYVQVGNVKGYKHECLHQYIWMAANGCDIPEGYDVHHIDGNPSNNSIYNLELIDHSLHMSKHSIGENNVMYGNTHTEESRKKISDSHKGKPSGMLGKFHSSESKKKISESKIGVYNNQKKSKKVAQYTLDGELVKVWESMMDCKRNGFNQGHISACCRGVLKKHKNFIWKYYE